LLKKLRVAREGVLFRQRTMCSAPDVRIRN
jgi:hypothetical protein